MKYLLTLVAVSPWLLCASMPQAAAGQQSAASPDVAVPSSAENTPARRPTVVATATGESGPGGQTIKGQVGQWHFGKRRPSGADDEEQPPGLAGLNATLASRCRRTSYPCSRPGFSRGADRP